MKVSSNVVRPDIDQVLAEMRAMKAKAGLEVSASDGVDQAGVAQATRGTDFQNLFASAVNQVNDIQKESGKLATAFQQGDPSVTLSQVVVASEKSGIAFEAMTEVRNRLVSAYEDIMNMPI